MKLSIQDRVALIYTSAGSQRATAALIGISHQKVGRILRMGQEGGYRLDSKVPRDFFLNVAVDMAFQDHKEKTRKQARAHDLPYSPTLPVFAQRMPHSNGVPGDRVEAPHLHWVSDSLRNAWIKSQHPSGKYMNISVGSIVNLHDYNRLANAVNAGKFRDEAQAATKAAIVQAIKDGIIAARIQTKYTRFDLGFPVNMILADVNSKLNQKHGPATGAPGTVFADRVLFQVKTTGGSDDKFRKAHPFKPSRASSPGAARKGKARAKKRG